MVIAGDTVGDAGAGRQTVRSLPDRVAAVDVAALSPRHCLGPSGETVHPFVLSFVVIFVAELGDKSQLMALTFATRFRALPVLVGISAATLVVHLASVAIGQTVGLLIPTTVLGVLGGLAFLAFGVWTLRGDKLDEAERARVDQTTGSVIVAVGVAFFLAELGDKTMLATIALATRADPLWVWLGSTAGMVAADALAIAVGRLLGTRLPDRMVRIGAALAFFVFGIALIAGAVIG
jgi:putative Ca2+/H+ antiporter (TMEM165/GDT1 family)